MESASGIETFGSPLLADVAFNQDGTLKASGKQNVKFYNKKRLSFRALKDANGELVWDKKTGLPKKEAFDEVVEMIRVETKGDTNIVDDVANDFHKRQFYRQYEYFRKGKIPDGNPIEDFEFLQPQTVIELHMLGIHVLQQVAEMSDLVCDQLKDQPGYEVRDIASQWIQINSPQGQAGKASKLELENAQLRRQLADAQTGKSGGHRVVPEKVDVPDEPIATMELSPAQAAKGPKSRTRKV